MAQENSKEFEESVLFCLLQCPWTRTRVEEEPEEGGVKLPDVVLTSEQSRAKDLACGHWTILRWD